MPHDSWRIVRSTTTYSYNGANSRASVSTARFALYLSFPVVSVLFFGQKTALQRGFYLTGGNSRAPGARQRVGLVLYSGGATTTHAPTGAMQQYLPLLSNAGNQPTLNAEGCYHQNGKRRKEPQLYFPFAEEIELAVLGVFCAEVHQQIEPTRNLRNDENSKQDYVNNPRLKS